MAHCPYELLKDLEPILSEIRKLPQIKEPKPGIFYLKGQGFLHFHIKDGRRWADARNGKKWGAEMDIPFAPSKKIIKEFLIEINRRYENTN